MRESFKPVDIEVALIAYLSPSLGVPVSTNVGPERPPRFVTLQRLDGDRPNLVQDQAVVTLRLWGESESDAADLAGEGYRLLDAAGGTFITPGVYVYPHVRINGPANDPDPKSGAPRFRITATLRTRLIATEESP